MAKARFEGEDGASYDPIPDTCPNCGGDLYVGEGQIRMNPDLSAANMSTSASGEERMDVTVNAKMCINCDYTVGEIEVSGYAGY